MTKSTFLLSRQLTLNTLYIVPQYAFGIRLSTCRRAEEDALSVFTPSRALMLFPYLLSCIYVSLPISLCRGGFTRVGINM